MRRTEAAELPRTSALLAAAALLALAAALAVSQLLGDSPTFDEAIHLPAGAVQWATGDLRLAPDHPPLARLWEALPSLLGTWRPADPSTPGWTAGEFVVAGRALLFEKNALEPLLLRARLMVVVLLLGLLVLVACVARRLFGDRAALLALAAAALSPALLAHGHLVTTDLPAALAFLAALLAWAAYAGRPTPARLAVSALATAALVLTKNSWPSVVPALLALGAVAVFRSPEGRARRAAALAGAGALAGLVAWGALWACYGFRFSPFRGEDAARARMHVPVRPGAGAPSGQEEAWREVLTDAAGAPVGGATATFVRWGRATRAFPEAWLYGLALVGKMSPRISYFRGEVGSGWLAYFPVAFLAKTPLPTLLLAALGAAALLLRRIRPRDPALAVGLAAFAVSYAAIAMATRMNIGHRHLLPLEPVLAVLAGASAAFATTRAGRIAVGTLVAWLGAAVLVAHPGELGYFNEAAGGFRGGTRLLADSNVDWGQDLDRLARWAHAHGDPEIRLAYFGVEDPRAAGLRAVDAGSLHPFGEARAPEPGVYAASVNQLVGLFLPQARDAFWEKPRVAEWYAERRAAARRGALLPGTPERDAFDAAVRGRLLNRLFRRTPDAYVGTSIRVYRLAAEDLEALLAP